jgi:hypothetical protein
MGVNDYGTAGDYTNAPSLADWAADVAAALDGDDTTVDTRITTAIATAVSQAAADVQYPVNVVGTSGATETLPATYIAHKVTMDQGCTFTFTSPSEAGHTFLLFLSGAFTPVFPGSVDWDSATPPTYTSPSLYSFTTFDTGSTWLGSQIAKGIG